MHQAVRSPRFGRVLLIGGLLLFARTEAQAPDTIRGIVSSHLDLGASPIPQDVLFSEIGADELDLVEIIMELEEEFGFEIPDDDAERIRTLGDAITYVEWVQAGRASPAPTLSEPPPRSALRAGESTSPARTSRSGTATRRLPRPRPRLPTEPQGGTTPPGAPGVSAETVVDEAVSEAYIASVVAYYNAIAEQNRIELQSFTELGGYNAWAFENRKRITERQQTAATVVLVGVLLLVLSGLAVSAIQFWIAMKHARAGKPETATTLKASLTSIEVSSSILGVIVLAISLLFFYLYLDRVFNLNVLPN